jgi:hypothetical protein
MAITKKGFKGASEERNVKSGGGFDGSSITNVVSSVPGGKEQESDASKGLGQSLDGPGDIETPPRSLYSAEMGSGVIDTANNASTGKAGAFPVGPAGAVPSSTGAGQGSKSVKTYGKGGVGGPAGLSTPGGALGRNTGK